MGLEAVDKSKLAREGYLHLPQHMVGIHGDEVAAGLGELLSLGSDSAVHQLIPANKCSSSPNTYSGIYGYDAFPFHTDLAHWRNPPRYLMLRCIRGYEQVPTLLLDGLAVVAAVGEDTLARALVSPRRPVAGRFTLLRIFQHDHGVSMVRWDERFLKAASPLGQVGLDTVRNAIGRQERISIVLKDPGDTVVIDNWRMLHARSSVLPGCEGRRIERGYLGRLH